MDFNFKVYYHNDMDGMFSRAIVQKYITEDYDLECSECGFPTEIETYSLDHSAADKEKLDLITGDETLVVIVDYSFSENTLDVFREIYNKVGIKNKLWWIDHHDSSVEFYRNHITHQIHRVDESKDIFYMSLRDIFISKAGSAAFLTWDHLYSYRQSTNASHLESPYFGNAILSVPLAIRLVSDYDTFTHNLRDPHAVNSYIADAFKLGFDTESDKDAYLFDMFNFIGDWNSDWENDNPKQMRTRKMTSDTIERGNVILKYVKTENAETIEAQGYESKLFDEKIYVCNRKSNSWVFGKYYNEYKYVVTWFFDGTEYRYSMFSNLKKFPDAECAKWAEIFGGGGHKGAAGWRSDHLMFKKDVFMSTPEHYYKAAKAANSCEAMCMDVD